MLTLSTLIASAAILAQPSVTEREEFLRAMLATWPSHGAITCEYRVIGLPPHWRKRVSYHFGSGAWTYWAADGKNGSSGVTPAGQFYTGQARLEAHAQVVADHSGLLDLYFPSLALRKHVERADALRELRKRPDGGYDVVLQLPRGQRDQTIEQIPKSLVDSLGGPQEIMRLVTFDVGPSFRPARRQCQGQPDKVYQLSDCGARGFTVSAKCPWPAEEVELISCTYDPRTSAEQFELAAVQTALTSWQREYGEIRTMIAPTGKVDSPVVSRADSASDPEGSLVRRPLPWLLGGGTLVLLGFLAWARRRTWRAL